MATLIFERGNSVDLGRLNGAERRVLRLLAEGHTAKSVANELGSTPAAVNERLREARRKTGVGSSRELARLLKSQENRHDQIGIGGRRPTVEDPGQRDAAPWRPQIGVIAMVTILVAAALATAMVGEPSDAGGQADPLLGGPVQRFSQPADQYQKVRAEKRDSTWAPRMEASLRSRLLKITPIGQDGNALRVTCGSTLCELAGTFMTPDQGNQADDPNLPVNRAVADLQGEPLRDDLSKLGLKDEGGSFLQGKGKPDRLVFLLYYSRSS